MVVFVATWYPMSFAILMARMHSLKTPSRSTIRSCVRSKPSRSTLEEHADFSLHVLDTAVWSFSYFACQPFTHFFAHEHRVGADVNDSFLREQSFYQRFDMRINQRFPAADGNHWRVALFCGGEAVLQAH